MHSCGGKRAVAAAFVSSLPRPKSSNLEAGKTYANGSQALTWFSARNQDKLAQDGVNIVQESEQTARRG